MLFVGHSGTGSCPVFGVGKAVLLPLIRSLKNRSWRTALHARRKENVFGKWIFSFQGSKGIGTAVLGTQNQNAPHRGKIPFTIHDIFRRFINGGKSFVYKLFTIRSLSGYHHNKNEKALLK